MTHVLFLSHGRVLWPLLHSGHSPRRVRRLSEPCALANSCSRAPSLLFTYASHRLSYSAACSFHFSFASSRNSSRRSSRQTRNCRFTHSSHFPHSIRPSAKQIPARRVVWLMMMYPP